MTQTVNSAGKSTTNLAADVAALQGTLGTIAAFAVANPSASAAIDAAVVKASKQIAAAMVVAPGTTGTSPVAAGKPGATNTGPMNPGSLTAHVGNITASTPNQVIQNLSITGTIYIQAHGVTVTNCKIDANGGSYGIEVMTPSGTASSTSGPSVTVSNCEIINATAGGVFGSNWTVDHCQIHEMGSDATDGAWNTTLTNSWIYNIGKTKGAHADGYQNAGGQNVVIKGNFFDLAWQSTSGGVTYTCNSCVFLEPNDNPIVNVLIQGNWIDGGNYSIYASGDSKVSVIDNVFGDDYQYGVCYQGESTVTTWSGNTDATTGKAV